MNREEAGSRVFDIYPVDVTSKEAQFVNSLLDVMYNNGLVLTQARGDMTSTDLADFEQTVLAWNTNENVELEDIGGQAIIQALQSRGWVILPPS